VRRDRGRSAIGRRWHGRQSRDGAAAKQKPASHDAENDSPRMPHDAQNIGRKQAACRRQSENVRLLFFEKVSSFEDED
jgi:hypothetical protein